MKNNWLKGGKLLTLSLMVLGSLTLSACKDYDDDIDRLTNDLAGLNQQLTDHARRLKALKEMAATLNTDLGTLSQLVKAIEEEGYITAVEKTEDGYIIQFNNHNPITIRDGKDGEQGEDGAKGNDGTTPDISIRQDTDGQYYWTLNGDWMMVGGHKVRAGGIDGSDGNPGTDAIAPQVRINSATNEWEVSADGGKTWVTTGTKATGPIGPDGNDGQKGETG